MSMHPSPGSAMRRAAPWLLSVAVVVLMQAAGAQPMRASEPPTQNKVHPAAATLPVGSGLCQCISDFDKLVFSCPGSAAGCRSTCGKKFSFLPEQQCPMPTPR